MAEDKRLPEGRHRVCVQLVLGKHLGGKREQTQRVADGQRSHRERMKLPLAALGNCQQLAKARAVRVLRQRRPAFGCCRRLFQGKGQIERARLERAGRNRPCVGQRPRDGKRQREPRGITRAETAAQRMAVDVAATALREHEYALRLTFSCQQVAQMPDRVARKVRPDLLAQPVDDHGMGGVREERRNPPAVRILRLENVHPRHNCAVGIRRHHDFAVLHQAPVVSDLHRRAARVQHARPQRTVGALHQPGNAVGQPLARLRRHFAPVNARRIVRLGCGDDDVAAWDTRRPLDAPDKLVCILDAERPHVRGNDDEPVVICAKNQCARKQVIIDGRPVLHARNDRLGRAGQHGRGALHGFTTGSRRCDGYSALW